MNQPFAIADPKAEVLSTTEAARLLGVSNTTIQIMVERGDLQAWKTRGGHRRISLESLERTKELRQARRDGHGTSDTVTVLIAEDDIDVRMLYERTIKGWGYAVRVLAAADGMDALLLIERHRPEVFVTDLRMRSMDGFRMLAMLRERPEFNTMTMIVITDLDDDAIQTSGGVPKGTALYRKPVPFDKLQGFLEASVLRKQLIGG
jgi:excisionase family DNA binding protein